MCKGCDGWGDYLTVQDFRRGKVEVEDFADEIPYRHAKRRKKKEKEKTRPGCPGNEYGPHVYVWTEEREAPDFFSRHYGFNKRQSLACIGCSKISKRKLSDKYEKIKARKYAAMYGNGEHQPRGEPVSRYGRLYRPSYSYWSWENLDEEYREKREAYIKRNGITAFWYNSY